MDEYEYKVIGPVENAEKAEMELKRQLAAGWEPIDMGNAKTGGLIYFRRDKNRGAGIGTKVRETEE